MSIKKIMLGRGIADKFAHELEEVEHEFEHEISEIEEKEAELEGRLKASKLNRDERESMSLLLWLLHYGLKNVGKTPHTKFHSDCC